MGETERNRRTFDKVKGESVDEKSVFGLHFRYPLQCSSGIYLSCYLITLECSCNLRLGTVLWQAFYTAFPAVQLPSHQTIII